MKNNNFSENIGTLGGAMQIMSPNFEANANSNVTNSHPYVYMSENSFKNNMAYFSGNAMYLGHTVNRFTDFKDYLNMCGAGVHIDSNLFEANIGLKRHNGGAIRHICHEYSTNTTTNAFYDSTSSLELAVRNKTDEEAGTNFTYYYDSPLTTMDNITDLFDIS